jgi:hypothetical protein
MAEHVSQRRSFLRELQSKSTDGIVKAESFLFDTLKQ